MLKVNTQFYKTASFDTHGLMARFKVTQGTVYICTEDKQVGTTFEKYPIETGETFDFVGFIRFYGDATIEYILFDKV